MSNNIEILKSKDRYSCNLCKSHYATPDNLYDINIGSINICLCTDCFRKVRLRMNAVILDGYNVCTTDDKEKEE